jgi:hypothetical protein
MLGLMHGLYAQAAKNLGAFLRNGTDPIGPMERRCHCFVCREVDYLRSQVTLRMSNPCPACADTGIVEDDNGNEWSCYRCSSTFPSQSTNRLLETYTPPSDDFVDAMKYLFQVHEDSRPKSVWPPFVATPPCYRNVGCMGQHKVDECPAPAVVEDKEAEAAGPPARIKSEGMPFHPDDVDCDWSPARYKRQLLDYMRQTQDPTGCECCVDQNTADRVREQLIAERRGENPDPYRDAWTQAAGVGVDPADYRSPALRLIDDLHRTRVTGQSPALFAGYEGGKMAFVNNAYQQTFRDRLIGDLKQTRIPEPVNPGANLLRDPEARKAAIDATVQAMPDMHEEFRKAFASDDQVVLVILLW